jgi:hypothetical protein
MSFFLDTGFSSTNPHFVTPDGSRITTPVEDSQTFDPSQPSLGPRGYILLPISKIPSYVDVAQALVLQAEARTFFITYASSLLPSSYLINITGRNPFFHLIACVLSSLQTLLGAVLLGAVGHRRYWLTMAAESTQA